MNLLAETAAPSATALKDFLEVVFYLAGVIAAVVVAWRAMSGKAAATEIEGQPIEVRAHPGSVTREELKQVHGRIERERREIDSAISELRTDSRERAAKLENKIDEQTAHFNDRFDALPQRMITLLTETKHLHKP